LLTGLTLSLNFENSLCVLNSRSAVQPTGIFVNNEKEEGSAMFKVFTAMKIQVAVFSVVTSCSDVIGERRFGEPCCPYLRGEVRCLRFFEQITLP
jgi:hypothetical protein